jgi:hypothetical protein
MSTENVSKINKLLSSIPAGVVLQSFWLAEKGYSFELQKRYRKSGWLESIGTGAMKRAGDLINYEGGLYALQHQSGMLAHPGGKTALSLLGMSHYLEFTPQAVIVFGGITEQFPQWFKSYDWGKEINYYKTSFLPPDIGLTEKDFKNFSIKISNAPRAIMECLYLVPAKQDLMECFHFMESMNNVRPILIQELLEKCESIKVKRLFLYLAEKANHDWFNRIDLKKVDLGKGKRSIEKDGVYNSTYQITVPKELEENDQRRI